MCCSVLPTDMSTGWFLFDNLLSYQFDYLQYKIRHTGFRFHTTTTCTRATFFLSRTQIVLSALICTIGRTRWTATNSFFSYKEDGQWNEWTFKISGSGFSSYHIIYVWFSYWQSSFRTNYGKLNIRYVGASIWNSIYEQTKSLGKTKLKNKMKWNKMLLIHTFKTKLYENRILFTN